MLWVTLEAVHFFWLHCLCHRDGSSLSSQVCCLIKSWIKFIWVNRFKLTLPFRRRIFKTLCFPEFGLACIFARVVVVTGSTSLCDATGDTYTPMHAWCYWRRTHDAAGVTHTMLLESHTRCYWSHTHHAIVYLCLFLEISGQTSIFLHDFLLFKDLNWPD